MPELVFYGTRLLAPATPRNSPRGLQSEEIPGQVNYLYFNNEPLEESAWCSIPFTEDNIGSVYLMLSYTTIYFIIPMITVTILYIRSSEVLANKQSWSKSVHV